MWESTEIQRIGLFSWGRSKAVIYTQRRSEGSSLNEERLNKFFKKYNWGSSCCGSVGWESYCTGLSCCGGVVSILALCSGLRIQRCCSCSIRHSYGLDSVLDLGTSICNLSVLAGEGGWGRGTWANFSLSFLGHRWAAWLSLAEKGSGKAYFCSIASAE